MHQQSLNYSHMNTNTNYDMYVPTRVMFGAGMLDKLNEQPMPGRRALIVISNGKSTRANGYLSRTEEQLHKAGVETFLFDGVMPNPTVGNVDAGAKAAREKGCDFLVALGGGSVMDCTKAIAVMATNEGELWDYVPIGSGKVLQAVRLVEKGARLIGTNTDLTGPTESGIAPACRALVAPIELATGKSAYFVGKPNPLMMRTGLRLLGVHSEEAAIIGDRMDTDMVAGVESGLDTALVLSGVTTREEIGQYPYRPRLVLNGVMDIPG